MVSARITDETIPFALKLAADSNMTGHSLLTKLIIYNTSGSKINIRVYIWNLTRKRFKILYRILCGNCIVFKEKVIFLSRHDCIMITSCIFHAFGMDFTKF